MLLGMTRLDPTGKERCMQRICSGSKRERREMGDGKGTFSVARCTHRGGHGGGQQRWLWVTGGSDGTSGKWGFSPGSCGPLVPVAQPRPHNWD
jgi:hypothetical protein